MTGQNLDETRGERSVASSSSAILSDVAETQTSPLFIQRLIVLEPNSSNELALFLPLPPASVDGSTASATIQRLPAVLGASPRQPFGLLFIRICRCVG
jgi:hypothetical protein